LREGKRTVLVAKALEAASPSQTHELRTYLGDPSLDTIHIDALRGIIVDTGALAEVETMIEQLADEAQAALQRVELNPPAGQVLSELVVAATSRKV
jgi:geranylgeranyl diphosphate synthase type I